MLHGRTRVVPCFLLWIWPDKPVEIARFEFVSFAAKRCYIEHAIIACAALKEIAKDQRQKRRVAAGAGAAYDAALSVNSTLFGEKFSAVLTIVDIDYPPGLVQAVAIGAAETSAAAVIHVQHRDSNDSSLDIDRVGPP